MILFKLVIVILAGIYQFFVLKNQLDKKTGYRNHILFDNSLAEE
jgi:hypothetical protein